MNYSAAQEFLNGCTKEVLIDAYQNEYLEWKRTGVLPDGIIRDTYNILSEDDDEYVSINYVDKMFNERLAELFFFEHYTNFSKEDALQHMINGHKVSHRFFTNDEYIHMIAQNIFTEDGCDCGTVSEFFWTSKHTEEWQKNWRIFKI